MDKIQRYDHVLKTAKAVIDGYSMDEIGKMSILSSILKSEFKEWGLNIGCRMRYR